MRRLQIFLAAFTLLTVNALADINNRMTLVEAIEAVREAGTEVIYSSRLVEDWMLVRETPQEQDLVDALRSALASYGLGLEAAADGKWLVVQTEIVDSPVDNEQPRPAVVASVPVQPRPLDEITIVGSQHSMYDRMSGADQFLTGDEIRLMPHIADDAYRALHRLPGVAANDFQAPFNLRGGTADEVKTQLDGFEIFEPFHMRTLFRPLSIIDAGIIGDAQVLSGGFTAEHGNYMSGVVDISTSRNDEEPVHELGVSFISAFARSSGPFADGRGSYFVSARRGYLDLLADTVVDEGEELQPRYGDLFGRVTYAVSDAADLSFQTLLSDDDVSFVDPGDGEDFGEDGSMQYFWLTADIEPVPGISSRTIAFAGQIDTDELGSQINPPGTIVLRSYSRDIELNGLQTDWQFSISDDHVFKLGARYRDLSVHYDYFLDSFRRSDFVDNGAPFVIQRDIDTRIDGDDISTYGSYRFRPTDSMILEFGLRWDEQDYGDIKYDAQVSPRVNALFDINDRTELRLAWGEFYQPHAIQDLQVQDADLMFYEPEQAEHITLGIKHDFESGLQLQADLYNKDYIELHPRYENLLDVYEFAPESNFDRVMVDPESGRSYGAEFTLRSRVDDSLNWWVSYTWSKVEDEIDGESVLRGWDQRHAVTASITWHGEHWSLSAIGRYHSGWPRTPLIVEPVTDGAGNVIDIDVDLSQRNSDNYDSYSRIDLRASRQVQLERGSFEFYLELFNVFNTENQCCTSNHSLSLGSTVTVSPQFDEFLPIFPSFGFVWRFGAGATD